MARRYRFFRPDEALRHPDHRRPADPARVAGAGLSRRRRHPVGYLLASLLGTGALAISPDLLDPRAPYTSCDLGAVAGASCLYLFRPGRGPISPAPT